MANQYGTAWSEDKNFNVPTNTIKRFSVNPGNRKAELPRDCKIFILGAPGVGKTTVANRLPNHFKSDNLEVIEVDFIKDIIRENFDKFNDILDDTEPCDYIKKIMVEKLSAKKKLVDSSSYKLNIEELLEQNQYILDSLIAACDKREEKGVPTILEGVNLDIETLYRKYSNIPALFKSIFIFDLYMKNDNEHKLRIQNRNEVRGIENKKAEEYLENFEKLRSINTRYQETCLNHTKKYKDGFNVFIIDNAESKKIDDTVKEIVGHIKEVLKLR
jgi:2-phosphoglycerate kinase